LCTRTLELPIALDTELIERLNRIRECGRPAFQISFSDDPHYVGPHVIVPVILSAGGSVLEYLPITLIALRDKYIALSSDDVKYVLNHIKYFERVKIEVEVKLPETIEGLPKPLIDAVNALRAALNDINNLDLANAIRKCRSAMEYITKHEKKDGQDVKVLREKLRMQYLVNMGVLQRRSTVIS